MELEASKLAELTQGALETTAFMISDVLDPEGASPEELFEEASRILIHGEQQQLELCLRASEGFLTELASSMLGTEPDEVDVHEEGVQALLELANILGGEVVMALGGEHDESLGLGLPETTDPGSLSGRGEISASLDSFGERLEVDLRAA